MSGVPRSEAAESSTMVHTAVAEVVGPEAPCLVIPEQEPAERPGSTALPEQVEALIAHAGASSKVTTIPASLLRNAARFLNLFGLSPIVPEHYLLADRNFVLDIEEARSRLGWEPRSDNIRMTCDAYDWYCEHWREVAPKPHPALRILEALT